MSWARASASSGKSPTWSAGQTTIPSSRGTTTPSNVITSAFPNVSATSSVTGAESGAPSDAATSGVAQTATPGTPTISPTTVGQPSARRHCGPWWLPARERSIATWAMAVRACPSDCAAASSAWNWGRVRTVASAGAEVVGDADGAPASVLAVGNDWAATIGAPAAEAISRTATNPNATTEAALRRFAFGLLIFFGLRASCGHAETCHAGVRFTTAGRISRPTNERARTCPLRDAPRTPVETETDFP